MPAKQPCLTLAQCKERSADSGFGTVIAGNHATKGCFRKKDRAYWGAGGSVAEMAATDLPSAQERLWCGEGGVGGQLLGEDCEIGPAATSLRACSGDSAHCQLRTGVCNNESGLHEGICRKKPTTCSKDFKPVCGCDQKTYSNEVSPRTWVLAPSSLCFNLAADVPACCSAWPMPQASVSPARKPATKRTFKNSSCQETTARSGLPPAPRARAAAAAAAKRTVG